ncbi:hypothetical protein NQZ68_010168 [Dissostichus eleginoides]|nr:hypothetical protein NQZ68_010168 [Dissostichus eleginoides]
MPMHVRHNKEQKAKDGQIFRLFVAQCFSLTGRGCGRRGSDALQPCGGLHCEQDVQDNFFDRKATTMDVT